MPSTAVAITPGLPSFLLTLKTQPVESSIEQFISLLKRRQIRNSRPCALATSQLLLRAVADFRGKDVAKLIARVRHVGQRLTAAQPRELAVGNIVRRVLGLIREVAEDGHNEGDTATMSDASPSPTPRDAQHRPAFKSSISTFSPLKHGATKPADHSAHHSEANRDPFHSSVDGPSTQRPPLLTSHTSFVQPSAPIVTSLFGLFSDPSAPSPIGTPTHPSGHSSPSTSTPAFTDLSQLSLKDKASVKDIKADVLDGIREILDELDQCTEQIAGYALEHIHADEIVLVHGSSTTVQKFLLTAARKRKFTVIHVESYPNDHLDTYSTVMHGRKKAGVGGGAGEEEEGNLDELRYRPLTAAGINVILIPDAAVFAIMSRVNKVILATHAVLANGGLVASVGARNIAQAARAHQTPVVVLSGVYKLSPLYPFDTEELIEYGDASRVLPYEDGKGVGGIEVMNPLSDYVEAGLVDLYITNLGGHAPSYLYRIVADHYRVEDVNL